MEPGVVLRIGIGDAHAMIAAEGHGYSPDLMHDMTARLAEALENTLLIAKEQGYLDISAEVDDDEDVEEEEEEVTDLGDIKWWLS